MYNYYNYECLCAFTFYPFFIVRILQISVSVYIIIVCVVCVLSFFRVHCPLNFIVIVIKNYDLNWLREKQFIELSS